MKKILARHSIRSVTNMNLDSDTRQVRISKANCKIRVLIPHLSIMKRKREKDPSSQKEVPTR